jgi:two-component system, NtrC family, response regulator AtoC
VIVLTGHADRELNLLAFERGAWDFIAKPVDPAMLKIIVERALHKHQTEQQLLRMQAQQTSASEEDFGLIGQSAAMIQLRSMISRIGQTRVPVLIQGASGTGKELVAKALHTQSTLSDKNMVTVNCGAFSKELLESELFGSEKGAYTGSHQKRTGFINEANNSTLFLDEVAEMPHDMQVKLLRVLQEGKFYSVGGREEQSVDLRVIAASHQDLAALVAKGEFREDLYYRLKGIVLTTPNLCDHKEDIALIAQNLIEKISQKYQRSFRLQPSVLFWLSQQTWQGNVRELNQTLESVTAFAPDSGEITMQEIHWLSGDAITEEDSDNSLDAQVKQLEIQLIKQALRQHNQNNTQSAQTLGISRQGLLKKMDRYGLR